MLRSILQSQIETKYLPIPVPTSLIKYYLTDL